MNVAPLILIWFLPLAVVTFVSKELRDQRRRMTIGDALIVIGGLAFAFALLRVGTALPAALGLLILYLTPFLLAILYFPRPWDVIIALFWSFGMLMLLVALIATIDS